MATFTTRLSLRKPAYTDYFDLVADYNNNWDILDNATRYNNAETLTANWEWGDSFRIRTGMLGIRTSSPRAYLSVQTQQQSTTLTHFTQAVDRAGILITTDYVTGSYTPGLFWQTNNSPTLPKAGIWTSVHATGSRLYLGTSNSYTTGITNTGILLDESGHVAIGGINPPSSILEVQGSTSSDADLYVLNTNTAGRSQVAFGESSGTKTAWIRRYGSTTTAPNCLEIWQYANADLRLGTNNTERMRIFSDGIVAARTAFRITYTTATNRYLAFNVDSVGRTTITTEGTADDAEIIFTDAPYINTHTEPNHGLVLYVPFDEYRGDDLLTDGELDVWTSSTNLTNWNEDMVLSSVRDIIQEDTVKFSGSYSAKFIATSNDGTTDFGIYQTVTTVSGQNYELIAYIRYAERTQGWIRLEAYDAVNNVTIKKIEYSAVGNYWNMIFIRFTAASATTKIMIYADNETSGTFYVDRVSLRRCGSIDASGYTNVYDHSVNAYKGTMKGSAIDPTLFYGKPALISNNSLGNSFVVMDVDDFAKPDAFTAEFWYRQFDSDCDVTGMGLFGWDTASLYPGFYCAFGTKYLILYMGANNYRQFSISTPSTPLDGNWHHIVVTLPGREQDAVESAALWIDGKLQGLDTANITGVQANKTTAFLIGASSKTTYEHIGAIAEFKLYNRALTPNEIRARYLRNISTVGAIKSRKFRVIDKVTNNTVVSSVDNKVGILTDSPESPLDVNGDSIRIRNSKSPSGPGDSTGVVGDICWDENRIYVKTNNGWRKVDLGTW